MPSPASSGWRLTHDMRATRFSARRRNGFLHLRSRFLILLMAGSCLLASAGQIVAAPTSTAHPPASAGPAPSSAPAKAPTPPPAATSAPQQSSHDNKPSAPSAKKLTRQDRIGLLADQLAHAKTPEEAHTLEDMLETLRSAGLSPTTQLLLRRAQKDVSAEKPDNAVDDMGDAIALQPEQAILWRSRAQMRLVAGDLAGAVQDLGAALQRDPKDAQSWNLLTTVEEHRNDGQAALKAWQKMLDLNPMADKNHKRLDALRIKAFGQPT
ncbi:hypothetical protein FOH24_14810 [Acetobacter tropicalis]|uniref:tetratricopeptide repeat protein n=1 Tax=Acetobacter tropicalis TaxID=104102 RepID=UPI00055361CA|nr:hypothetical protein [Acetobacter tropicalis]KAA8386639.1 hypothetical protein FOH24_14810 [Acetobacter tropicalis]KAA8388860.1 hypothetical protein FOH22_07705 [Acetobacter tropicalis]MBC9009028.1 hypothetical protein [Acetobacter tropicalis]MDO8172174.1 hypothetical protein [Acetobacter tropicalis]